MKKSLDYSHIQTWRPMKDAPSDITSIIVKLRKPGVANKYGCYREVKRHSKYPWLWVDQYVSGNSWPEEYLIGWVNDEI